VSDRRKTNGERGSRLTSLDRVILLNYREDGITPYVTVWKHGLSEMKV